MNVLKNSKKTIIKPSGAKSYALIFSKLNDELKERVLNNPSYVLLSTQLLLREYKINSTIYPINVYISNNNLCSISWHLSIDTFKDVERFYENFGEYISIPYKKENISNSLQQHIKSQSFLPSKLRYAYYLLIMSKIEKLKGYFYTRDIINKYGLRKKTVITTIGELKANNFVVKIGKQGRFHKMKITEKGRNIISDYPSYQEFKDLIL